jgi:hypothetical protein
MLVSIAEHAGKTARYGAPWLVVVNNLHHTLCHTSKEITILKKSKENENKAPL